MPLFILKHTMLVFNYSAYYDKGKHNLQCINRYMLRSKDISTKICYFNLHVFQDSCSSTKIT